MIDIEQRALRALEQDALAFAALAVQQPPDGLSVGQQHRRECGELLHDVSRVEFCEAETAAQRIVMRQQAIDLVRQRGEIGEIHQTDRTAADLVFIGRADAALGGADGRSLVGILAQCIEFAVQRQDQRDVFGNAQIVRADIDALAAELGDFIDEGLRVEHHAIADHRELGLAHDARRQQRQLVGLTIDDQRMTGIVAALIAGDDISLIRQPVNDLALTLVAPLGADDDNIGHLALVL